MTGGGGTGVGWLTVGVGGMGVAVGGTGVAVAGTRTAVGGTGVAVMAGVAAAVPRVAEVVVWDVAGVAAVPAVSLVRSGVRLVVAVAAVAVLLGVPRVAVLSAPLDEPPQAALSSASPAIAVMVSALTGIALASSDLPARV